jgi:PTH1 family peptidyl-tRNA hydrolase
VPLRRGTAARRGTPSDLLVVGLANPGKEFDGTRHNVGGDAVRELARRLGVTLKSEPRQRAATATVTCAVGRVTLAVPTTFMNDSGSALPGLLRRSALADVRELVIVHDELDLEPGRLQLKRGGGLAGHNGLRSIASVLQTQEFARLRIGVGKPPSSDRGADHVLQPLRGKRGEELAATVNAAADALELIVHDGIDIAQQQINGAARG